VYGYGTRQKINFSLGKCTTVFHSEVYAIKAYAADNLDRDYKNRNISILPDSQVAIKALDNYEIDSKLVWDCLVKLAKHNRVQQIWMSGHKGIEGNEIADQPAKLGSECPLIGP
jgi:ribonuclease HI